MITFDFNHGHFWIGLIHNGNIWKWDYSNIFQYFLPAIYYYLNLATSMNLNRIPIPISKCKEGQVVLIRNVCKIVNIY